MKNLLPLLTAILFATICHAQTGNVGIGTSAPGSKLTVNGSFAAPYRIETSTSANIGANDYYVAYNGASAGTLTLPAAATTTLGRTYHIKNTSSFVLTISSAAANQIDNQSGAGVTSITLQPGYYAFIISKGTTGATTTWEVAIVGSVDPSTKPQMVVISITASNNNVQRITNGSETALNNDVVTVNTIPGATYTASAGATKGYVRVPAGTYLVTMVLEADFVPTTSASISGPGTLPVHSFFYELPDNTKRLHASATSNFGGNSNTSVQMQSVVTVGASTDFEFAVGWGQGGNVIANAGNNYHFGKSTQLSIIRVL